MSDAEILTTSFVASLFFGGNHCLACRYMFENSLVKYMLEKSRFNRRLHSLSRLMNDLFHQVGMIIKESNDSMEYLLDSFPVPLCDNIRIFNVKLVKSEDFRGYIASKKRYFYGIRVQLLTTKTGIPVEFVFLPGSYSDIQAFNALPLNLPPNSEVYTDSGYTDYQAEDTLSQESQIQLKVMRKKNSGRKEPAYCQYTKQHIRHYIETVFSQITSHFPKSIHAVTIQGFFLKIQSFIWSFTLEKAFLN